MGFNDTPNIKIRRKLLTHVKFGFTVETNLTEEDLTAMFPSEEKLAAYFRSVGTPVTDGDADVVTKKPRYRFQEVRRYGNEEWLQFAACYLSDIEFTPVIEFHRTSYKTVMRKVADDATAEVYAALRVCASCPVAQECFARSIQRREANGFGEAGVWAGTLEPHRRVMLGLRRKSSPETLAAGLSLDTYVCTRCLRPAEDERHCNTALDEDCPGAVTGIQLRYAIEAIFQRDEPTMVRTV